jgi:hypothetical protein
MHSDPRARRLGLTTANHSSPTPRGLGQNLPLLAVLLALMTSAVANAVLPYAPRCEPSPLVQPSPAGPGWFPLFTPSGAAPLVVEAGEAEVVRVAGRALAGDLQLAGAVAPSLLPEAPTSASSVILVGTLAASPLLQALAEAGRFDASRINAGQWESYLITVISDPFPGIAQALIIAGSDPRGAAFGAFELSRLIGVSPWAWWADAPVARHQSLHVSPGLHAYGPPSIRYRGIFINDEGWGLWPWASQTHDPEFGDIGPKTYERVFELLLRLRANHLWPAMHPNTKSFQLVPENRETARRYGIVIGSSHAEPLLFNNAGPEWQTSRDGPWDFRRNRSGVLGAMERRVRLAAPYENIYTLGMRGIHDSAMQGVNSPEEGAQLLAEVIESQRDLLERHGGKPAREIPQVFVPYKEVLRQYDSGLAVPEDVTLMWPDDNFGLIRRFSTGPERERPGRGGVYYHLSYLGSPQPYLWLSPMSPALVWREMRRAWLADMDQIWIANVGDIKRREWNTEFFLDLAWNIDSWDASTLHDFFRRVAARDISADHADEIGALMWDYHRLAAERKPEFMGFSEAQWGGFTPVRDPLFSLWRHGDEVARRLDDYQRLADQAKALAERIPPAARDSFFQLVSYPVLGAAAMNEKHLQAYRSREYARQGRAEANRASDLAFAAHDRIQELTRVYNEEVAGGKWRHVTSARNGWRAGSTVFFEPRTARVAPQPGAGLGVAIEGAADPLAPLEGGPLPPVEGEPSIVALPLAGARLEGSWLRGEDAVGPHIAWNASADASAPQLSAWDAIPFGVHHPTRAVFEFYHDEPLGGVHTLYLSVNHPNADSDSWWVTVNEFEPVLVNDRVGRIERLRVEGFVLRHGLNRLVLHPREAGAQLYGAEFVREAGLSSPATAASPQLPRFHRHLGESRFVDLFNRGSDRLAWSAVASAPWIRLSATTGTLVASSERLLVSIDHELAPALPDLQGHIDIHSGPIAYRVEVRAFNQPLLAAPGAHAEANGIISIEARHHVISQPGAAASWRALPGLGRTSAAMVLHPLSEWRLEPSDAKSLRRESPFLEYEVVVLAGGPAEIRIEAVPAFPTDRHQPARLALTLGDGEPVWITFDPGAEGSPQWQGSALESRMTGSAKLVLSAGVHRLRLWGVDPAVAIERFFIAFGEQPASYLGAPETLCRPEPAATESR